MAAGGRSVARALACALAAASAAAVAGPSFTADFSQTAAPLNMPLLDCVGSGHGSLALRADYREHLARVQRDIGFKHVRGHGLLHDDMSALLGGRASLANLFSVVDFYLSVGLRPFFEVSYMPQALAADPDALIMHYRACVSAFAADKAQAWAAFVAEVFAGLEARYGADEVRTWSIECWNEPAGPGFLPRPNMTRLAAYFELYEVTARAVASVDPLLRVGGPATQNLLWIPDLLNFTDAGRRVPQRFVSTHYYPTEMGAAEITRTSWEDNITAAADVAEAAGLPLVVTEFSAGLANGAYDAPFAAAFVVHAAAAFLGARNVPTLSWWTFSDVFEETGFMSQTWVNTYGLQTKYGVPKPAYRAFEMLAALPSTGVFVDADAGGAPRRPRSGPAARCTATVGTVDVVTAVDASLGTTVVLHALVTNFNANVENATDPTTGLPIATASGVTIKFSGLPAHAVLPTAASLSLIDSKHAWARPAFVANGSPMYPTPAQIAAEQEASLVVPVPIALLDHGGGQVSFTLPDLEPYAVARVLVTIAVPPPRPL
jgi:xylan 1,4-beta-xylosidase